MFRALVFGLVSLTVFVGLVAVSPYLDGRVDSTVLISAPAQAVPSLGAEVEEPWGPYLAGTSTEERL